MWEVRNRTPFSAQGCFVRDRAGVEFWVVAIRGRFVARPDELVDVAEIQDEVRLVPSYADAEARELWAESDFAPFRRNADVVLRGSACAPDRAAVRQGMVRMQVGHIEKSARILGPRQLRRPRGLHGRHALDGPEHYREVALSWRSSLGGTDPFETARADAEPHPENPIGRGWTSRWLDIPTGAEIELPMIENPEQPVRLGEPLPQPHGFGALQPSWQPRRDHAGTYDEVWRNERAPLPPDDFSEAFHQAVPADQIYPGELRGGEPVTIEGLHPDGPYSFRLPQTIIEAETRIGRDRSLDRFRIVGVDINGSAKTVDIIWNMATPCSGRDHLVDRSVIRIKQIAGVARSG
jgi:hypothetical protein